MDTGDGRQPLLAGRGLVLLADFCRSAGLEPATVEALIRAGEIEGVLAHDGRVAGVFEDVLPTAEKFHLLGLTVSSGYNPDDLRGSYESGSDDPDEPDGEEGPTWTMSR